MTFQWIISFWRRMPWWLRLCAAFGLVFISAWLYLASSGGNKLVLTERFNKLLTDEQKLNLAGIVELEDCAAFTIFADSLARPGLILDDTCPWANVDNIGRFELNGIKLVVSRAYMWTGRTKPNGKTGGLGLMLHYPSMASASASGDQSNNIIITFSGKKSAVTCRGNNNCARVEEWILRGRLGLNKCQQSLEQCIDTKYRRISGAHDDFDKVEVTLRDFFIKVTPNGHYKWLKCSRFTPNQPSRNLRCETVIDINEKLSVSVRFRRSLILSHKIDDVMDSVEAFISTIIVDVENSG